MKKLLLFVLSFLLLTGSFAAAENSSVPVKRSLYTTLYMKGEHAFTLGHFKIPLSGNSKVQEVSLVGTGEHVKLSWNAYASRGYLVIEIQSEKLISPGAEKYTLSARIDNTFINETFSIHVLDSIPFDSQDIAIDIPSEMYVGESFTLPTLRTYSGKPLSKSTSLSFTCKDSRLTQTGDDHYTATAAGDIPWIATLQNGNYFHKIPGETAITVKPEFIASEIRAIDTSTLATSVTLPLINGYEALGTILVHADIAEGDSIEAALNGGEDIVQLFLCDPIVNGTDYLYAVIAADAASEGTTAYTFTATAGDCSVSTTFDITVFPAESPFGAP